ncbi:Heat shock 70kD protein binding protein [Giardia muris]|uniref:Heat shock 70kD protein binding protein n=1 Tax=Giardia muris TaxID=5742 RepID=A0A4Z1SWY2_GIAMU|nr:Heat shock 70kD protein binding protein [Giardia muris]|eukprot:TNJ28038.1 Heat shock 70kD protein binding protein [Giardia muris]
MSSDSDIPELEAVYASEELRSLYIDYGSLSLGDPEAPLAEDAFERAMELRSRALEATEPNEAVLLITDAIKLCPTSGMMLCTRARLLYDIGELTPALRDLDVAVQRAPNHAASYRLRGRCLAHLCRYNQAVESLSMAQKLDYCPEIEKTLRDCQGKVQELRAEEQKERERFEAVRKEAEARQERARQESFKDRLYAEVDAAKQRGSLPEGFQILDNMRREATSLSDEMAKKLLENSETSAAMDDPEFARKLDEMAKNPATCAEHMKDPEFARAFMGIVNCFK